MSNTMTEPTKNVIIGCVLTAVLAFMGIEFDRISSQNIETGKHLVKIDTLLEIAATQVPTVVEGKFSELRIRLNQQEVRLNQQQEIINSLENAAVSSVPYKRSRIMSPKEDGN